MHRHFYDKKIYFMQILDDLKITMDARKGGSEINMSPNAISTCLEKLIEKVKDKSSTRKRIISRKIGFCLTALDQLLGSWHGVKDANMIKEYEDLLLVRAGIVKTSTLSSCLERYIAKVKENPDTLRNSVLREKIYFEQVLFFVYSIKHILITHGVIKPGEQVSEYEELAGLYISHIFCSVLNEYNGKSICRFQIANDEIEQQKKEIAGLKAENKTLKKNLKAAEKSKADNGLVRQLG